MPVDLLLGKVLGVKHARREHARGLLRNGLGLVGVHREWLVEHAVKT